MNLQLSLFSPKRTFVAQEVESIPYVDPFLAHHAETLAKAGDSRLAFDEDTWDHQAGGAVGVDVECFVNCFIICFRRFATGRRIALEMSARSTLDRTLLQSLMTNTLVSFNGNVYDFPMIYLALAGADTVRLKAASDEIVLGNHRPWETEKALGIRVPALNHIDLMEPNPSISQGLKMLQGRLHCRFMVDLPFHHDATLTLPQMNVVTLYCMNDLESTETVYRALREPLEMRAVLGRKYGMDLRSKSDSQVGEAIVKRRVETITRTKIRRGVAAEPRFTYKPPSFLQFESDQLIRVLNTLRGLVFQVNGSGRVATPPYLEGLKIPVGDMVYTMGIGGLHSTETHRALRSDANSFLLDVDVASQYPNIIMKLGLYPPALGPAFLQVYGELIKDRLAAKAAGDKVQADGGRVALNGVYGKLSSPYSILHSPNLGIAITLTGQLAILMLIERAELAGIPVVSANTDGVVFRCPRVLEERLKTIVAQWEHDTGFVIENTRYAALYSSSVNTYIAVREDGKVKRKGYLSDPWEDGDLRGQMSKNPQMTICSAAVVKCLVEGIPIEETITQCRDPRAFITVIKVTGGALWRGHPLGRAIRYFWSLDGDPIFYADGSKRVSKTEGARPLQELTDKMPPSVDFLRYCEEASRMAADLGVPGL